MRQSSSTQVSEEATQTTGTPKTLNQKRNTGEAGLTIEWIAIALGAILTIAFILWSLMMSGFKGG